MRNKIETAPLSELTMDNCLCSYFLVGNKQSLANKEPGLVEQENSLRLPTVNIKEKQHKRYLS